MEGVPSRTRQELLRPSSLPGLAFFLAARRLFACLFLRPQSPPSSGGHAADLFSSCPASRLFCGRLRFLGLIFQTSIFGSDFVDLISGGFAGLSSANLLFPFSANGKALLLSVESTRYNFSSSPTISRLFRRSSFLGRPAVIGTSAAYQKYVCKPRIMIF